MAGADGCHTTDRGPTNPQSVEIRLWSFLWELHMLGIAAVAYNYVSPINGWSPDSSAGITLRFVIAFLLGRGQKPDRSRQLMATCFSMRVGSFEY